MSDHMNDAIRGARLRGTHVDPAQPPAADPAAPATDFNGGTRTPVPVEPGPASMNALMRAHRLARGMSGDRSTPPTAAEFDSALDQFRNVD